MKPAQTWSLIDRELQLIFKHPNIALAEDLRLDEATGTSQCQIEVKVHFPSKYQALGSTPTGVRVVEPVKLTFPHNYPLRAPKIELRSDFNRALPHIQTSSPGQPVEPCIYEGSLDELLAREGISAIFEHLLTWLGRAAEGELIDPEQGWEPVRRDCYHHCVTTNSDELRALLQNPKNAQRPFIFPLVYQNIGLSESIPTETCFILEVFSRQERSLIYNSQPNLDLISSSKPDSGLYYGTGLALFVPPDTLSLRQQPESTQQYQPESVTNWESLKHQAQNYGCTRAFEEGIEQLTRYFKSLKTANRKIVRPVPLVIIFAVLRPHNLIGHDSNIELLTYLIEVNAATVFKHPINPSVYPTLHRDTISLSLLQSLSGHPPLPPQRDTVLVGCGSLGSKIGIHLARSGRAPQAAIDNRCLSPHNFARHALYPHFSGLVHDVQNYKSHAFAQAVQTLNQSCQAHVQDITTSRTAEEWKALFPKTTWGVINATATLNVQEALSALPRKCLRARVIETSLFANGQMGLITIEGAKRNPTTGDLNALFYDRVRQDPRLGQLLFGSTSHAHQQAIGNGCSSPTMQVSDGRISLFAASMAEYIVQLQTQNFAPDSGQMLIGSLSASGIDLTWEMLEIEPFHIVDIINSHPWQVHIFPQAHQKMTSEQAQYPAVETGGLLMGCYSDYQRVLFVTDVLEAPPDSERSAQKFVLGVEDRNAEVNDYANNSNNVLNWIGTWHTHLKPSPPSSLDHETATRFGEDFGQPFVLLVKDPLTYHAVMTLPFSERHPTTSH